MEDSILKSTKKILNIKDDYTAFDLDILTHINATFAVLSQIGIGPTSGYIIDDDTATWTDLALPTDQLNMIKTYIYLKVRMLFDPPSTSFHIEATTKQLDEYLQRLSYLREDLIPLIPDEEEADLEVTYASGIQSTPVSVWIMDHNLGYEPAAVVFRTLDGETELEPEEIQYVNDNRILALWPESIAGTWRVS